VTSWPARCAGGSEKRRRRCWSTWGATPGRTRPARTPDSAIALPSAARTRSSRPCPVVVTVDGTVSGLGCALLLAADVRFGSRRAAVRAGDGPAATLLAGAGRVSSASAAAIDRLCWTAGTLTGEPAVAAGVLTALGSFEDARACAIRLAADPVGWSAVKRAHRGRTRPELETALRYESWLLDIALHG
jgi:enoyl-CoA hydratase/carnithine racemase